MDSKKIEEFRQTGFIIERALLSENEVSEISFHLDKICATDPANSREDKYFESSELDDSARILVRIEDFIDSHPLLANILLSSKVIHSVEHLLGGEAVLFKDKVNFKPPGCREDTLHYDHVGGWYRYADFFVSVAIVIDLNCEENAAMRFLNDGGKYRKYLMESHLRRISPADFSGESFILLELQPGDAVFFDSYVPHWSPANQGKLQRRNILITFNRKADGNHRKQYYEDIRKEYSG